MSGPSPWNEERDEQLAAFWRDGLTTGEIGRRMGRSTHAIAYRAAILGLKAGRRASSQSRGMVSRPAARAHRELPGSDTRAAFSSRPSAATISGVSSAVERRASSLPVENLPEAVAETPPPRVFSKSCCFPMWRDKERATHVLLRGAGNGRLRRKTAPILRRALCRVLHYTGQECDESAARNMAEKSRHGLGARVMRVEKIGLATLYLGDARDVLPEMQADHVIGDPPYEDELHDAFGKFARLRGDGKKYRSNTIETLGFDGINAERAEMARLCVQASQGWVILFTFAEGVMAWRDGLQAAGAKYDTCCAWIKPDAAPRFNGQGPARGFECFVTAWAAPGYRSWNAGGKRGVYRHLVNNPEREGQHPTEKPRALMSEIIGDFTRDGQSILDPFMGSGTTGVSATQMRRSFIGVEREPRYFDIACRRIEEAQRQGDMFRDAPP